MGALSQVHYQFQRLQATATEDCTVDSVPPCMEPSEVFLWPDMLSAVRKMADTGVAGRQLYTGPTAGAEWATGHRYALANLAAFLAQSMQESIQYDACDENNWSDPKVVAQAGGSVYVATSACGQLGQSYQDYHCTETLDP